MTPVLVTGATGRHGGTGAHVVRRLREEDRDVRVLARTRGDRTAALEALGAEVVIGDLQDRRTIVPALQSVAQAYFTYPIDAGVGGAAANFAAAAEESGTSPRTVVMSMGPAHPSGRGRDQWLAEEVLRWAGLDLLVLRVAAFHENVLAINGRDAAEPAVAALLHPERFDGPGCHPAGAEELTHHEIAAVLAERLGRPVRFEPVTAEQRRAELVALSEVEDVVNADMAGHITAVAERVAVHGSTTAADENGLARLIGRTPVTFREYARTL